eukprot:TRINITY_DN203_c0_g1_i3.p2 TRINITY_DN203_c0_g1~~TRINITY_DN203_c0_g1_i3.p2  ORF type:complete len:199 (+),score=35.53 TRINITY_DN203_c0_g1_i3:87-599(+)
MEALTAVTLAIAEAMRSPAGGRLDQTPAVSLVTPIPDFCLPVLFPPPHVPLSWLTAAAFGTVLVAVAAFKARSHRAGHVTLLPPHVATLAAAGVWGLVLASSIHEALDNRSVRLRYCEQFLPIRPSLGGRRGRPRAQLGCGGGGALWAVAHVVGGLRAFAIGSVAKYKVL